MRLKYTLEVNVINSNKCLTFILRQRPYNWKYSLLFNLIQFKATCCCCIGDTFSVRTSLLELRLLIKENGGTYFMLFKVVI